MKVSIQNPHNNPQKQTLVIKLMQIGLQEQFLMALSTTELMAFAEKFKV